MWRWPREVVNVNYRGIHIGLYPSKYYILNNFEEAIAWQDREAEDTLTMLEETRNTSAV